MTRLPSLGPRGEGWVAIQVVLLGAIGVAGWLLGPDWDWPASDWSAVVGVGLVVGGAAQAALGLLHLGGSLTPLPHPRSDAELIESGMYGRVRHPIYGGLIVGAVGWALVRASLVTLALAGLLWLFFRLKSAREEAWLLEWFPGYADYRSRTRRFFPVP